MYSKTTGRVTVTVKPYFLDDQSSPSDNHYVWAYNVNINNKGDDVLKLRHRTWIIIDGNGRVLQVQGEGVVGETPEIKPGETFEYTSGTPLKTTSGIMQGYYSMVGSKGKSFKIDIPTFSLDSPYEKKKIH
tara:strand:+ start:120 stop:512 length:393 start_codon:yes stop_codon:yes gene_type:complete